MSNLAANRKVSQPLGHSTSATNWVQQDFLGLSNNSRELPRLTLSIADHFMRRDGLMLCGQISGVAGHYCGAASVNPTISWTTTENSGSEDFSFVKETSLLYLGQEL